MDYSDKDIYSRDTDQNVLVDFDNFNNTSLSDLFDELDLDNLIDNLNDWD